jgi:predicted dehydrogenase
MSDSLRLAIVGCGAVVEQRYLGAMRRCKWLPAALIDPSPARRRTIAGALGIQPREAACASEALDAFDAAIVAAPHALHEPLCTELLRAGKHVLVEKPMAATPAQCAAMLAAADEGGARLAVALMRRQAKAGRWLKEALAARAFGRVHRFAIHEGYEYAWPLASDSMWRREQAGGGVLIDTGAHTTDQVIWWFGVPDELEYFDDADGGVEANALLRLKWRDGSSGTVDLSRTRTLSNRLVLSTEMGQLTLGMAGNELQAPPAMLAFESRSVGKPPFPAIQSPDLFVDQLAEFRKFAASQPAAVVDGADAARSVGLIDRCYAARQRLELPWLHYLPERVA